MAQNVDSVSLFASTLFTAEAVAKVQPRLALARIRLGEFGAAGELVSTCLAQRKLEPRLRDELAVQGQARLDAVARDLVERFGAAGLDTTLAPGDAGLFTDNGGAFDPLDEVGLSSRIALSAAVDPQAGGQVWRMRDGLGAATPGATGDASLLIALSDALTAARPTSSTALPAGSRSLAGLASNILSFASSDRLTAETEQAFSAARYASLDEIEKAGGVDTDQELQSLLVIEKNYAANAKVIQAVDEMIKTLLGL